VRFGKISANEFFNTVDFNGDGEISLNEFVEFWEIVKGSGHTEEEIREEVSCDFRLTSLKFVILFINHIFV
jgi:Ca2+-binding EF-hand superfamily protein